VANKLQADGNQAQLITRAELRLSQHRSQILHTERPRTRVRTRVVRRTWDTYRVLVLIGRLNPTRSTLGPRDDAVQAHAPVSSEPKPRGAS